VTLGEALGWNMFQGNVARGIAGNTSAEEVGNLSGLWE
jgi:hypothetical protein